MRSYVASHLLFYKTYVIIKSQIKLKILIVTRLERDDNI